MSDGEAFATEDVVVSASTGVERHHVRDHVGIVGIELRLADGDDVRMVESLDQLRFRRQHLVSQTDEADGLLDARALEDVVLGRVGRSTPMAPIRVRPRPGRGSSGSSVIQRGSSGCKTPGDGPYPGIVAGHRSGWRRLGNRRSIL